MTKTRQNVGEDEKYYSGDTLVIKTTVESDDGSSKDLTDASVKYGISDAPGEQTVVEKSDGNGIQITDPASGKLEITIDSVDTEDLDGSFYHECEVTDSSGDVSTVFTGVFRIAEDTV